jgi:hypothetical protein
MAMEMELEMGLIVMMIEEVCIYICVCLFVLSVLQLQDFVLRIGMWVGDSVYVLIYWHGPEMRWQGDKSIRQGGI